MKNVSKKYFIIICLMEWSVIFFHYKLNMEDIFTIT